MPPQKSYTYLWHQTAVSHQKWSAAPIRWFPAPITEIALILLILTATFIIATPKSGKIPQNTENYPNLV